MLFSRYRKMAQCPSNVPEIYSTNIDAGHAPLTGLELNVTCFAPTLVQVGCVDASNNFTPYYTGSANCPELGQPETTTLNFPNLVNDGSQQLGVCVTNLDGTSARDVYLDMTGTEAG